MRKKSIHVAPWERSFEQLLTPLEQFIHHQTSGGVVLLLVTIMTLVVANTDLRHGYEALLHTYFTIKVADFELSYSLQHWVNDGLMAIFFFVVGLELKREIIVGELSNLRKALLPIFAAIGGVIFPALIYFIFNYNSEGAQGWGIPMATDLAFALCILKLFGKRVPTGLLSFLIALAIVDDLVAILVIAIFYTEQIHGLALVWAMGALFMMFFLNLVGIRRSLPYLVLGTFLWFFLLKSGVHATLAGVLAALTIPSKPRYNPNIFSQKMKILLERFDKKHIDQPDTMRNVGLLSVLQKISDTVFQVTTPLQKLEYQMHIPVAFFVLPIFAFFNAGLSIDLPSLKATLAHPVSMGVSFGLLLGKVVGVSLASLLALKLKLTELPSNVKFSNIIGVGFLAGIGFTMAIFITELSFASGTSLNLMAKTGVFFSSIVAGVLGYIFLYITLPKPVEKEFSSGR